MSGKLRLRCSEVHERFLHRLGYVILKGERQAGGGMAIVIDDSGGNVLVCRFSLCGPSVGRFAETGLIWLKLQLASCFRVKSWGRCVKTSIRLQTSRAQFGGERFTCPFVSEATPCNKRVDMLYLPPGAKIFGCRKCHGLTYQSCQDAPRFQRVHAQIKSLQRSSTS